jgi:phosphohistidine phosphatase SixA
MRLLVRHAHAGDKHHWSGPDAERPLSIRGWSQAEGLLDTLADLPVERLLTSPSLRCRQTLLPLAAALDLDLEWVDDLGVDGDTDHVVELLAAPDSDGAVLCTHGEVLGDLLARLRARGDRPAEGRLRYEKGSTWVLEEAADGRLHARYLPPPAAPAEHR